MRLKHWPGFLIGSLLATTACPALLAEGPGDWSSYGHDESHARHSQLTVITPENVHQLRKLWTFNMRPEGQAAEAVAMPDTSAPPQPSRYSASQATPLVVDGTMYLPTPYNRIVALNASTGEERWVFVLPDKDQASTRGVAYWPGDGEVGPRIVFGSRNGKLYALDAATGRLAEGFGESGAVNMKTPEVMNGTRAPLGMTSPPAIYRNLIITGSRVQEMPVKGARGDVRAWNAVTGELVWTFHTIPRPGEPGFETWEGDSWKDRSGANVWTFIPVDNERGIAYLPVGAPTYDRWGGDRPGENLYGNSVVAVNAATGEYLWHFQTVHHDIWDVDLPVVTLVDVKRDGETIPAIVAMNKMAIMFILDRVTGEPLYDVTEVPVPTETDIPDERPWPTQPMPAKPAPLARLSFDMSEIVEGPPTLRAACEKVAAELNVVGSKMFQPLRADSAVAFFPGSLGGVDWGGGSFDPATSLYVVNINSLGSPQQMEQQPDGSWGMKTGYTYFRDPETGHPCGKPPWGELVAVNVNTGDVAWRTVLGDNEEPLLKDAGRISAGGPITTASGLTFIGATTDSMIRAFDTRTGELLWKDQLPASNYGTPMTYAMEDGRQALAVVATGGFASQPPTADEVVVYTLP